MDSVEEVIISGFPNMNLTVDVANGNLEAKEAPAF